jgi:hypothetical protein
MPEAIYIDKFGKRLIYGIIGLEHVDMGVLGWTKYPDEKYTWFTQSEDRATVTAFLMGICFKSAQQ